MTVEICESNDIGEVITHDVSNINVGDYDGPTLTIANCPIKAGENLIQDYGGFIRYCVNGFIDGE